MEWGPGPGEGHPRAMEGVLGGSWGSSVLNTGAESLGQGSLVSPASGVGAWSEAQGVSGRCGVGVPGTWCQSLEPFLGVLGGFLVLGHGTWSLVPGVPMSGVQSGSSLWLLGEGKIWGPHSALEWGRGRFGILT